MPSGIACRQGSERLPRKRTASTILGAPSCRSLSGGREPASRFPDARGRRGAVVRLGSPIRKSQRTSVRDLPAARAPERPRRRTRRAESESPAANRGTDANSTHLATRRADPARNLPARLSASCAVPNGAGPQYPQRTRDPRASAPTFPARARGLPRATPSRAPYVRGERAEVGQLQPAEPLTHRRDVAVQQNERDLTQECPGSSEGAVTVTARPAPPPARSRIAKRDTAARSP